MLSGSPEPTHAVDVTDTLELGIASLRAHSTYLEHVGGGTDFLAEWAAGAGEQLGTKYATTFEVYEF